MDAYESNKAFNTPKSQPQSFPEKNNGRVVGSRYKSPTPRRFPSPNSTRTVTPSAPVQTRAVSTGRRPATPPSPPSPTTPVHDTSVYTGLAVGKASGNKLPESLWPSRMRSLSVAFQSNTFSMPVVKMEKPPPTYDRALKPSSNVSSPTYRKCTPERKRSPLRGKNLTDQSENSKPLDGLHSKRIDQHRWPSRTSNSNVLNKSIDLHDESIKKIITSNLRRTSDLVSSTSLEKNGGFLSPSSPNKSSGVTRGVSPSRTRVMNSGPSASPSRTRVMSSGPSRGVSPNRMKPSSPSRELCNSNTVSVLTFVADMKKGKKVTTRIEDAHHLRLLYNRQVQWGFVNACAEVVLNSQKVTTEKSLIGAQRTISRLQDSVAAKRICICQLKLQLKLYLALNQHLAYLNEWCSIEREHDFALHGAIEDLQASTLRLPVTGLATATIQSVKSAIYSGIQVMQTMGSSIQSTLSRLERTNWLVYELATVAAQERSLLDQCRTLMTSASSLQVEENSLRTHVVQLKQDLKSL